MNKPALMPSTLSGQNTAAANALRTAGIVLAGTLFLAACSHISLPLYFTPVPLTLQPFGVLLLGMILGPRMAFGTLVAFLAEGAMGLPVFVPSSVALSGLAHLLGPTGGYLMAYPFAAMLIATLWRRGNRGFGSALVSAAVGDILLLTVGALWLAIWTHGSPAAVFTQAVLPFLPGEALKVAAAAGIGIGASRLRRAN